MKFSYQIYFFHYPHPRQSHRTNQKIAKVSKIGKKFKLIGIVEESFRNEIKQEKLKNASREDRSRNLRSVHFRETLFQEHDQSC